jgi:transcriptional regulator with XRE-family HTH domain
MCRDGEAVFSLSEFARLLGVSRAALYRWETLASIPDDEFEEVLNDFNARGKKLSTTAVADEIRRRTGRAREYSESCPHCGGELRRRWR